LEFEEFAVAAEDRWVVVVGCLDGVTDHCGEVLGLFYVAVDRDLRGFVGLGAGRGDGAGGQLKLRLEETVGGFRAFFQEGWGVDCGHDGLLVYGVYTD
jgi:hypothetical protein